jgi:hypothetical protein
MTPTGITARTVPEPVRERFVQPSIPTVTSPAGMQNIQLNVRLNQRADRQLQRALSTAKPASG